MHGYPTSGAAVWLLNPDFRDQNGSGTAPFDGEGVALRRVRRAVYLHVDLTPDLRCNGRQDPMVGNCAHGTGHHATLWAP